MTRRYYLILYTLFHTEAVWLSEVLLCHRDVTVRAYNELVKLTHRQQNIHDTNTSPGPEYSMATNKGDSGDVTLTAHFHTAGRVKPPEHKHPHV